MTAKDKKKLAEFERDIKIMQKEHKKTFAEFEEKKSLPAKIRTDDKRSTSRYKSANISVHTCIGARSRAIKEKARHYCRDFIAETLALT